MKSTSIPPLFLLGLTLSSSAFTNSTTAQCLKPISHKSDGTAVFSSLNHSGQIVNQPTNEAKENIKILGSKGFLSQIGFSMPGISKWLDSIGFTQNYVHNHLGLVGRHFIMNDILKALAADPPQRIVLASHSAGVEETQAAINLVLEFFRWARTECAQNHGHIRTGLGFFDGRLANQSFYKSIGLGYSVPDLQKRPGDKGPFDKYCELAKQYYLGPGYLGSQGQDPKVVADWIILDKSHLLSGHKMHVDSTSVESIIAVSSSTPGLGSQDTQNLIRSKNKRNPAILTTETGLVLNAQPIGENDLARRKVGGIEYYQVSCGHLTVDRAFYEGNKSDCYEGNKDWFHLRLKSLEKDACVAKGYRWSEPSAQAIQRSPAVLDKKSKHL